MCGRFTCEKSCKQLALESVSAFSRERQREVWVNSVCYVAHAAPWCYTQESWGKTGPVEFTAQYLTFKSLQVSPMYFFFFGGC